MSNIEPALTPEEWATREAARYYSLRLNESCVDIDGGDIVFEMPEERHALAAMLLHGQPFGFTWADVDLLRNEFSMLIGDIDEAEDAHWRSLADRIAALLPPREREDRHAMSDDDNGYVRGDDGPQEWPFVTWMWIPEFTCPICSGTVRTEKPTAVATDAAGNVTSWHVGPCGGCGTTFKVEQTKPFMP